MHNYANLCINMHATDIILFSSLCTIMRKVCVKFNPNPIFSIEEQVEQVDGQTEGLTDRQSEIIY